jgi:hypothetical protein
LGDGDVISITKEDVDENLNLDESNDNEKFTIEIETWSNSQGTKKRYGYQYGTLSYLIKKFEYTLESGASFQNEKGKSKINLHPKNIDELLKNLHLASNNSAIDGHSDKIFRVISNTQPHKNSAYEQRDLDVIDEAKADTIYTIECENSGGRYGRGNRPNSYYYQTGTLAELIKAYSYTLEVGESWQSEKGNHKINRNPKNINALIDNLNWAVDNAAADGYSGKVHRILPEGEPQKKS